MFKRSIKCTGESATHERYGRPDDYDDDGGDADDDYWDDDDDNDDDDDEVNSVFYTLPPLPPLEWNSPNLAEAWRRWQNGHDTFYKLRIVDQIPEDKRMFLLLQALGSEAVSIYYDMDFDMEGGRQNNVP